MNIRYIKLMVLSLLLGAVGFGIVRVAATEAQTYTTTSTVTTSDMTMPSSCLNFSSDMWIGMTSGNVVALQNFLNGQGMMSYASTGYYGPITMASVVRFQAANGISTTGYVGPITRARISAISCGSVPPAPMPYGVSISNINPNGGPVGTTVTITGTGFTNDNTVYLAGGAIQHLPATTIYNYSNSIVCNGYPTCTTPLQSITFTIPEAIGQYCPPNMACIMMARMITPGTYDIVVGNDSFGKSNPASFTVTGSGNNGAPLSIIGIDAPNQISMTVPGTWTVRTNAAQATTLHYSVLWGDEGYYATSGIMAPTYPSVSSSASFSHAYQRAGTFNPTFTVSDDYGHSVTTSATVTVTPIY